MNIHLIRNQHRTTAGHGFNHGDAEVFLMAGEGEQRGIDIGFESITAVEHAGE